MLVSTYISGAARWNAGPVAIGSVDTRPIAAGTVAGYRLQEAAPGGASTPTEGLTTRRTNLLMANSNPTDDGPAVVLQTPTRNLPFLRFLFTAGRDGIREDLCGFADELREPARRLREEAVYGRIPRIDTLVKLASSLEVSADTLLAGIERLPARDTRTGTFWVGAGPAEPDPTDGSS